MTSLEPTDQTPEVEVTVWHDGDVIDRQYCDTVDEANALAELWADRGSVQVNIHAAGSDIADESDPLVPMDTPDAEPMQ